MKNPFRLSEDGSHCIVQFRNGGEFMVDAIDLPLVEPYTWILGKRGYPATSIHKKNVCLHKLLFSDVRGMDIDHISGDKLDNRRINLRICTHQQNMWNQRRRSTNSTGYTGVSYSKNAKCYEAYINLHGRKRHLGLFRHAEEAAKVRDRAALEMYGEFARLNFPTQSSGVAYG